MSVYETICSQAEALAPELIAQRRDFHKYAESGWLEMRTTSIVAKKLTDLGYEVLLGEAVCKKDSRMGVPSQEVLDKAYDRACAQGGEPDFLPYTKGGMTGVIGILRCGEGPTVAMRFDIDALGVIESQEPDHRPFREGFASVNDGAMHACGHDGHTCVGLGVAQVLMERKDQLHGTVKLIFQPAEEGVRGAKSIVDNGHLDNVDYLLGAHVSAMDAEESDITPGAYGSLATGKYDVIFHGLAAHAGAGPEKGNNALLAAATALLNLQAIPRNGGGSTRINVGKLVGGSGRNVIADEAFMEIEVRGQTTELNTYMENYMRRILEAAAQMHGCTVDVKLMGAAPSLNSDEALARRIGKICADRLGMKVSSQAMERSGGSEDVAYLMNRVQEQGGQATFMRIRTQTAAGAHNRRYDFEESFIPKSIKIFCAAVYDLMQ
ncbi:MAG: amidohydrolase [Ruminococcaceae bacterium]|nr:amidohydrolase [Oscillospiraceae bacterium]